MEQRTAEQRRDYNVLLNLRDRLAEAEADRAPKWYTARLRREVEKQEAKLEGLLVTDQPSPSSEEGVFEVWGVSAKARGDGEVYADRRSAEIALEMAAGGAYAIVEGIAKDYRVVEVEDGWSVLDIGFGTEEPRWLIEDEGGWRWGDHPVFAENQEDLGVWYVRRDGKFVEEEASR